MSELVPLSFDQISRLATSVVKSGLYGIRSQDQAETLMHLCVAKGLHPIEAVERYHIIDNRPSMSAAAMHAEFQRQGGRIVWSRTDGRECVATFSHPHHAPTPLELRKTFAEMDAAGVTRNSRGELKDNWRKFPAQMLRARLISEGVRAILPGVVCGIYTPEEIMDFGPREARDITPPVRTPEVLHEPDPVPEPDPIEASSADAIIAALTECATEHDLGVVARRLRPEYDRLSAEDQARVRAARDARKVELKGSVNAA